MTCENSLTHDDNSNSVIDSSCNNDTQDHNINTDNITQDQNVNADNVRKSLRVTKLPSYLQDYYVNNTDVHKKTKYPIQSCLFIPRLSHSFQGIIMNIDNNMEPKSYNEAVKYPAWQKAMDTKLTTLEHNKTWTLTNLPPNCNTVGCK